MYIVKGLFVCFSLIGLTACHSLNENSIPNGKIQDRLETGIHSNDNKSNNKNKNKNSTNIMKTNLTGKKDAPNSSFNKSYNNDRFLNGNDHVTELQEKYIDDYVFGNSYYGKISWYKSGKKTASGSSFNPNGLSAAHKSLPFGTKLNITNLDNGKSVIVTVNDRGPFVAGRILDVSYGAAKQLDFVGRGILRAKISILYPKKDSEFASND